MNIPTPKLFLFFKQLIHTFFSSSQYAIPSPNTVSAATTEASTSLTWRAYLDINGVLKVDNYQNTNISYHHHPFVNTTLQNTLQMVYNPSTSSYMIVSFSGDTFSVARLVQNETDITFEYIHPVEFKYHVSFGELGGWFVQEEALYIWYTLVGPEYRIYLSKFEFAWN